MSSYEAFVKQIFSNGEYSIVPIRMEDRHNIMKWRNEQIYHLRQNKLLTEADQNRYFETVVKELFNEEQPNQILFSYLKGDTCIGYGGLVHINWIDKNAEISFVIDTEVQKTEFLKHWCIYLDLIEDFAFNELNFYKIYTYAFDLRPNLYVALENNKFQKEAVLKKHCFFNNIFIDVIIHSKFNDMGIMIEKNKLFLRDAVQSDAELLFCWVNEQNVRNNSVRQDPIIWDNHLKWYNNKLKDSESKIFILCVENISLGQIRIDKSEFYWDIDYSIDYKFRGMGLGNELVRLLLEKFCLFKFRATVKKENLASIKVFTKLGFKEMHIESKEFDFFEY